MEAPKGEATSTPIKIAKGLDEGIERFLETEDAKLLGFRYKSDIVNTAVREFLVKHGLEELLEKTNPFEHFNVYDDHVTIWDKTKRRLIDVYFQNGNIYCSQCESNQCEHIKFTLTIPKVIDSLHKKGWQIEDGKIVHKHILM